MGLILPVIYTFCYPNDVSLLDKAYPSFAYPSVKKKENKTQLYLDTILRSFVLTYGRP